MTEQVWYNPMDNTIHVNWLLGTDCLFCEHCIHVGEL
jgi:hypothetical protein